jgi:hypothetical protein
LNTVPVNRLVREAVDRFRRDGPVSLGEDLLDFGYRRAVRPVVHRVVSRWLDETVVTGAALRDGVSGRDVWTLEEDHRAFSRQLLNKIVPLREEDGLSYNPYPTYVFREPFVTTVEGALLLGPDPVALTRDGRVLSETVHTTANPYHDRIIRATASAFVDAPVTAVRAASGWIDDTVATERIDCAAVLQSRWNNYYHWTLEHLPKLRGVARYERETGRHVSLVVPDDPPPFVMESLELFGYADRVVPWEETPTLVETLIVPSFPELLPRTLEWVRDRAFYSVPPDPDAPDWIYVSRAGADKRRVDNEAELRPVLERHGVEPVRLERSTLREEISLLQSVDGVVGAHGAGLTATLWGSDLTVIELFNDVVKPPYYTMATVLDHDYTALSGHPVGAHPKERNRDFTVDPASLDAVLSQRV